MGIEVIHNSIQKARKKYGDDAYEFISETVRGYNGFDKGVYSFAELRMLVAVKQGRESARYIMPGDTYVRQRNKMDGTVFTFRAKKLYHDICCKYDLYPED